ncbi:MAG: branched-chain amino acid ABC transporter permease [Oscillospiraceae bacterium]|jgi:branched-chain amino acid transport system permease protein|nr:branched-chain amino acid ABC transporter permease [Oscillospiraceae bacterium]
MAAFFQNIVGGIETGSMYALAAMGLVLIYQTAKLNNFSQGTLGMFNAFFCTSLFRAGVPLLVAILLALVFALILGALIDTVVISGIKNISALGRQMITLGLIMVFQGLAPMLYGTNPFSFSKMISASALDLWGVKVLPNSFLIIGLTCALMLGLYFFLERSNWGLAVRVTAANPMTAKLMGVPIRRVTMGAWGVATALGCLSALMVAPITNINVSMMENIHLNSFIASVLGGFQTFYGPVIGAFIIGVANNLIGYYISSKWSLAILYAFILLFIVIRPNGLFGKKTINKV